MLRTHVAKVLETLYNVSSLGKGNHQTTQAFVMKPFCNWKKAIEKFREHQSKEYHKNAAESAANFKLIFENKKNDVLCEIDKGRQKQQLENRQKLRSIIRTVLVCGRQGLALRGHRDYGRFSVEMPTENDGNFRTLLRFAIESGDSVLKKHIETAGENATYISWRVQNEIIENAGNIIQSKIVSRINNSKCFSIIADETTDVSGIEQFSICVRYVDVVESEKKLLILHTALNL